MNITINASNLFDRYFTVFTLGAINLVEKGSTQEATEFPGYADAKKPLTLQFKPGKYRIIVPSCGYSDVIFEVTETGLEYDDSLKACLQGRGTTTLTVKGLPVTVDGTYVGMNGAWGVFLMNGAHGPQVYKDFIAQKKSIYLLPGLYDVEQGSSTLSSFAVALDKEGRFDYKADFDLVNGGFLSGKGTSTLVFRGYPFLVDATKVATNVYFFNVNGLQAGANGVQFVNLLPSQVPYQIGFGGPGITKLMQKMGVTLSTDGTITTITDAIYDNVVYRPFQDTFNGVPRLTIMKVDRSATI